MPHIIKILTLALVASSCARSPTGRLQLILIPDAQMDALGADAFAQIVETTPMERDPLVVDYVSCVAQEVVSVVDSDTDWQLVIIDDDAVNAFALPGGRIGVFRGLLQAARTQEQLAAVIAHEVGHVLSRHGAERVSQALVLQGGLAAADAAMRDRQTRPLVLGALGLGAQLGVLLPFSRRHESEADRIGLQIMARAGFDPREAPRLWENMGEMAEAQPPEFLSTHPSHGRRIEDLREGLPVAMDLYEEAKTEGREPQCGRGLSIRYPDES